MDLITLETAYFNSFQATAGSLIYTNLKHVKFEHFPTLINAYKRAFISGNVCGVSDCTFLFGLEREEDLKNNFSFPVTNEAYDEYIEVISFLLLIENYVSIGTIPQDKLQLFINKPSIERRALKFIKSQYRDLYLTELKLFYASIGILAFNKSKELPAIVKEIWDLYFDKRDQKSDFLTLYYFISYRFADTGLFDDFLEYAKEKIKLYMESNPGFKFIKKVLNKEDLNPIETHELSFSLRSEKRDIGLKPEDFKTESVKNMINKRNEYHSDHQYLISIDVNTYRCPGWQIEFYMPTPLNHIHFDPGLYNSNTTDLLTEIGWEHKALEPEDFIKLFEALTEKFNITWDSWYSGYTSIPRSHKKVEKWFLERCQIEEKKYSY